jgi:hypothetical protein
MSRVEVVQNPHVCWYSVVIDERLVLATLTYRQVLLGTVDETLLLYNMIECITRWYL